MQLKNIKEDITFQFTYSKWQYAKKLIVAVLTGVFFISLAGLDFLYYRIYDKPFSLIAALIVAFGGFFPTINAWRKFNQYSVEVAFFKMWEKKVGVCGIGQKENDIYIFFDIGKTQEINKQTLEFLNTFQILGPIVYMQANCDKYQPSQIHGVNIHEGDFVEFLVSKKQEKCQC